MSSSSMQGSPSRRRRQSARKTSLVEPTAQALLEIERAQPGFHPTGILNERQQHYLELLSTAGYAHLDLAFSRSLGKLDTRRSAPAPARAKRAPGGPSNLEPNTFGGVAPRFEERGPPFRTQVGVPLDVAPAWESVRATTSQSRFRPISRTRSLSLSERRPQSAEFLSQTTFAGRANARAPPVVRSTFGEQDRFAEAGLGLLVASGGVGAGGSIAGRFTQLSADLQRPTHSVSILGGPAFSFAQAAVRGLPKVAGEEALGVERETGPGPAHYRPRHPLDLSSTKRSMIGVRLRRQEASGTVTPGPLTATWDTIPRSNAPSASLLGKWTREMTW